MKPFLTSCLSTFHVRVRLLLFQVVSCLHPHSSPLLHFHWYSARCHCHLVFIILPLFHHTGFDRIMHTTLPTRAFIRIRKSMRLLNASGKIVVSCALTGSMDCLFTYPRQKHHLKYGKIGGNTVRYSERYFMTGTVDDILSPVSK